MKPLAMTFGIATLVLAASSAFAAGEASGAAATSRSMHEWYAMGGPAMHALALCSVLVIGLILERSFVLRQAAFVPRSLEQEISGAIASGQPRDIKALCENNTSALGRLALLALAGNGGRERLETQGAAVAHHAHRNLPLLAALGNLATLVGLLGTVLGMVEAFEVIAQSGSGDAQLVASGIFRALVTTAAGLTIGILALTAHAFLNRRATDFIVELESVVTEVAEIASERPRGWTEPRFPSGAPFMKFGIKPAPDTSPNIAPLLDVVLLLLIFFMVTTSFAAHQLPLDLPDAHAPALEEKEALIISIDADGSYSIDGEPLKEGTLANRIKMIAAEDGSLEIRADGATPHADVVRVLDLANQFDLTRIGIRVVPKAPRPRS